jgi:hypothetical protein
MKRALVVTIGVTMWATPGAAQTSDQQLKESRYQIGQMERVLEGAVEHGAAVMRDRLRVVLPADLLLTENARVRGFRLDGYGMFFDVEVPSLQGATFWSLQTLDRNDLGLVSALEALRSHVNAAGDTNLQQALKRLELEVAPLAAPQGFGASGPALPTSGSPAAARDGGVSTASYLSLDNAVEAWRTEIKNALMDAMLEHSRGLGIGPDEWLVIAARGNYERPPLAPADSDAQTVVIRVRGSDLSAFLGGQLTHEEARKRMDVKVF